MNRSRLFLLVGSLVVAGLAAVLFQTQFYHHHRVSHGPGVLPEGAAACLAAPKEMILYSLDPDPRATKKEFGKPPVEEFHGSAVLGKVAITIPADRILVADTIRRGLQAWDGGYPMCFFPRHGLHLSDGSHAYDLLVCFECTRIETYTDKGAAETTGVDVSPAALNALLTAAHIPLPEQPGAVK